MKYLLSLLVLLAGPTFAQVTNLVLDPVITGGKTAPKLTWANPTAGSCTASGDSAWVTAYNAASKPVSGTLTLPVTAPPNARSYTLTCTWPGDVTATIEWTAPTTSTDGTALAKCASQTATGSCLRAFTVYHGTSATTLTEVRPIDDRNAVSYVWTPLPTGNHFFAVTATNGNGIEGTFSNVASKALTAGATDSQTVTLAFPGTTIITVK